MKESARKQSERLRDRGILRAIRNANRRCHRWQEKALNFLRNFPEEEFRTEEVRVWAHVHGLPLPPHPRAWGAVTVRAHKEGLIEFIGYAQVENPRAHRTPAGLWKRKSRQDS
jgi:hypothetical protein